MILNLWTSRAGLASWAESPRFQSGFCHSLAKYFYLFFVKFLGEHCCCNKKWVLGIVLLVCSGQAVFAQSGGLNQIPPRQMLRIVPKHEGSLIRFYVENLESADVTATFDLSLVNLKGNATFPLTRTFLPNQLSEAFQLAPIRTEAEWHYSLTNYCTLGSNEAIHDDTCIYRLPYGSGRAFSVSQGFNGSFSHSGPERFAIDWSMPEGTPVLAARGGKVVALKEDSQLGGPEKNYEGLANFVLIQHKDGTVGNYAHLQAYGIKVKVGQNVAAGEPIGLSGNTGYTSGPHLHFNVFKTRNGSERESISIRFRTEDGEAITLLQGCFYSAPTVLFNSQMTSSRREGKHF